MASHGVARTAQTRIGQRQDVAKIKTYHVLESQIRAQAALGSYDLELLNLTTKLLQLNPEYYTIWNIRRRCLLKGVLSFPPEYNSSDVTSMTLAEQHDSISTALQSDLAFTVPLLLKFPKCYWIWNFRSWILSQMTLRLPIPTVRKIWEMELALTSKMHIKDRRNFHAWGYRREIVAKLESPDLQGKSMSEAEFAYTTKMINEDLSNFSAWHNRTQLVARVLDERGADDETRRGFLDMELKTTQDALNVGPEDQSLWYYHQFLMSQIVGRHENRQTIVPSLTTSQATAYLRREIDNLKDLLEDYSDIKWIYLGLLDWTSALERVEGPANSGDRELNESKVWLAKLRALDVLRAGRWDDMEECVA
ncbi:uncharacterized protein B0I36DRAFT_375281 [Microdochium trichocladiopsis]|uniref:Geranylgeranyl transferase type-2 subunit alpha n=1 Tax=Microdochium trichocladiopsis TaxID=1682393 RepID=A0A9P9BN48_9PEZI|nr:uncharacterized protein B0I36DRAFT_375281 [Microdochium trichocladiopsis]KAH7027353.1 hypothetical protein B0I36DRAFT_375281 [Microdochium trichocladiopsis]